MVKTYSNPSDPLIAIKQQQADEAAQRRVRQQRADRQFADLAAKHLDIQQGVNPRPEATEKLTEGEEALVEDWEKNGPKYPHVEGFLKHRGIKKSYLYKVLAKAERVNGKPYTRRKRRRRQ